MAKNIQGLKQKQSPPPSRTVKSNILLRFYTTPPPQHLNHQDVNKIFKFKPQALFPSPFIADTRAT